MKILYVSPENVGAVWPMFKEYAERVLPLTRKRRCATKFLLDLIKNFEILWVVAGDDGKIIGFCSSAIVDYDDVKLLQVRMLAGDFFSEWIDELHELLEKFAKENNCDGLELIGRRGWVRKLERFGWREAFVTVERRFDK
jgi:hypothetical protein